MIRYLIVVLLGSAALGLGVPGSRAEENPARGLGLVRIVAEGRTIRTPDIAVVRLTVLRQSAEADKAVAASNEAARQVIAALLATGIEKDDMQSADFQIAPRFNFTAPPDGTPPSSTIEGYDVRNTLMVRVRDVSRTGRILDIALKNGVNEGGSVELMVEDVAGAVDEARGNAIVAATKSAKVMAEKAGVKLGPIVAIEDQPAATVFPYASTDARLRAAASDGGVPVETGKSVVTARVAVSYWMEK